MKRNIIYYLAGFYCCALLTSCVAEHGTDGLNSLISTEVEAAGNNCDAGGIQINYGLDTNNNNILDDSEVQNSNYICNGTSGNVELDNLTRISLGSPDAYTCGTQWFFTEHNSWQLDDFNKRNYANVSSILFVPSMVSYEPGNVVTVELFNVTDNVPIAGSQLTHNTDDFIFKYSEDIYNNLPDYPITLSIRIKNSNADHCGGLGTFSYLYILRE